MAFELIHPHLCHSESIAPHMGRQVLRVGLMGSLDMGNPCTGKDLNAAPTLPHLVMHITLSQTEHAKCDDALVCFHWSSAHAFHAQPEQI